MGEDTWPQSRASRLQPEPPARLRSQSAGGNDGLDKKEPPKGILKAQKVDSPPDNPRTGGNKNVAFGDDEEIPAGSPYSFASDTELTRNDALQ